ncbi:hypothetical protein ACE103_29330 [Bradyrhizobium sp. ma5]|uniref:hypothetical protein n=1 Tax=Bradyrhizobium sp. ma5 TaxID=3344828 RepID=UPI0035D4C6DA
MSLDIDMMRAGKCIAARSRQKEISVPAGAPCAQARVALFVDDATSGMRRHEFSLRGKAGESFVQLSANI